MKTYGCVEMKLDKEPYSSPDLLKCGYTPENVRAAKPEDMEKYYSAAEQAEYGVVGIELDRL